MRSQLAAADTCHEGLTSLRTKYLGVLVTGNLQERRNLDCPYITAADYYSLLGMVSYLICIQRGSGASQTCAYSS